MKSSVCNSPTDEWDFIWEIIDVINSCTPRQRRKLRRQNIICPKLLEAFWIKECLPLGFPVEQGIKVDKFLMSLKNPKSKYRNQKNRHNAERLCDVFLMDAFENLAQKVSEIGGPQQLQSSSYLIERAELYKNRKEKGSPDNR